MANNPFLDNDPGYANSTIQGGYDAVREGYDQAYQDSTAASNRFAKYYDQDRNRYRSAVGGNGLGAQAAYRSAWEDTSPGWQQSSDAFNRSMDASGAASGSMYSGGNAIQRSVGMTDLNNRMFREHQADLGGLFGNSQQAEAGRVSNQNQFLTNLYPSLRSASDTQQLSIDNANTNFSNQQALQNQQLAQAEQNSNTSFWGSLLSGGIGLLGSLFCSETLKEEIEPVEDQGEGRTPFADRLRLLDLFFWKYKPEVAQQLGDHNRHISPMAEQWKELFGGSDFTISQQDVLGVTMGMLKEMDKRVQRLEAENAALRMEAERAR